MRALTKKGIIMIAMIGMAILCMMCGENKPVEIRGYLLGAAPPGMPAVMEELNRRLLKDINAEMEINYIGWGDFQSKYPLILASGQDFDWIYTANWAFYFQQAAKGAFMEITEDMLEKYMPRHYAALPKNAYNEMKVNGKMYMIPTSTPDRKIPVTLIRADLRKKYNVPEIRKYSDLEAYLEAIRKNEPEMIPMALDKSYDIGRPYAALAAELGDYYFDILFATGSGSGVDYNLNDPGHKLVYHCEGKNLENHKTAAAIMKRWYDKGYINRDVFANTVRSKDSFSLGKSAVGIGNSQDVQANISDAIAKGWEIEIVPELDAKGHYYADPHINNGVALAAGTKNAEVTMKALDMIMEEKTYNYLVYLGIEGTNYVIKDGKIDLPEGLSADANTYPPDAAGFWFTNKDQLLPFAGWTDLYIKMKNDIKNKGYLVPTIFQTMPVDTETIKTELATLNQVMVQYEQPIQAGMVKDIEEAFGLLDEKLKAAGVMKVKEALQKQVDAYLASIR
ncbi:MAG: extracellular solute-binding protein [Spirochaetales bacterium]|nr:extracellular solute-binding protein [Spirochaetales bacterium]